MTTRRQKLRDVFALAASQGASAFDLVKSIEAFTSGGGSGIESYLDQTLAQGLAPAVGVSSDVQQAIKDASSYLQKAEDALNSVL